MLLWGVLEFAPISQQVQQQVRCVVCEHAMPAMLCLRCLLPPHKARYLVGLMILQQHVDNDPTTNACLPACRRLWSSWPCTTAQTSAQPLRRCFGWWERRRCMGARWRASGRTRKHPTLRMTSALGCNADWMEQPTWQCWELAAPSSLTCRPGGQTATSTTAGQQQQQCGR